MLPNAGRYASKESPSQTAGFTKTGKLHATCRAVIRLLHPAGFSSATRAPLSFGDEHFWRREQRPAWRGKRDSAARSVCNFLASALAATFSSSAQGREGGNAVVMLVAA